MNSKQNEIEEIVDDLIENTIIEALAGAFSSVRECSVAMEVLKEKLEEVEDSTFKGLFE